MTDLITSNSNALKATAVANPFGSVTGNLSSNVATTQASTHELAEMQAQIFLAKQFPRDQQQATDNILTACQRPGLANVAVYSYARGGTQIMGPSIRLAEEIARNWGNLECGWNELEREYDKSKLCAFAWDKQTNVLKKLVFYVPHYRTTKLERKRITDERDLYELLANQAARRMRNCILALIPGDVIDAAVEQCQKTMVTHVDISPESIKKLVDAFATFGVTKNQIEKRIQRRIDSITPAQVVRMREIYTSLNDGMSDPADWFEPDEEKVDSTAKKKGANATAATESLKTALKGSSATTDATAEQKKSNRQSKSGQAKNAENTPLQAELITNAETTEPTTEIDKYRARIVNAKSKDELTAIMEELFKRDDLSDGDRDNLYLLIDDFTERLS